ncbi:GNAT family N-acetyltransferase [Deinococcus fonticola]|uniref:GNAT family N-acetyltransferase n=1 Tax=Deinococcus fonticola TaxID=2528713 RepID=UPI001074D60D|nr:GNAT family N-acetyltransferase [Deinococcus fonticola]
MTTPEKTRLLAAYDAQCRDEAEVLAADRSDRCGPLWRAWYGKRGFVTYCSLDGLDGQALDNLIAQTVADFAADPEIQSFEWKTRGHDQPADLPERLLRHGFQADEQETVMVGDAALLAQDIALPEGVTVRRIDNVPDPYPEMVRAADAQARAFGFPFGVEDFMRRLEKKPGLVEIWVAETPDEVVCTGRLEAVPDSEFAGLWGGGTVPEWHGKGIYRALTAARARSALARGLRYLQSDCTEFSRPILEKSGLLAVTTTTPYLWRR